MKDIKSFISFLKQPPWVRSFYIGGGTPSLVGSEMLQTLLKTLFDSFSVSQPIEVTVEVNPTDVTNALMQDLCRAGVNRISIGIQSLSDERLLEIDRLHTSEQAIQAVHAAKAAGIPSVSIDLLYGLPNQTIEGWGRDLSRAIDLEPDHISAYSLTLYNASSKLRASRLGEILTDDDLAVYYETACAELSLARYDHYEVSSWAKSGHQSIYNKAIWHGSEYLGFGCGAHATVGNRRYSTMNNPASYIQAIANGDNVVDWAEELTHNDLLAESIGGSLRTTDGLDLVMVQETFAVDLTNTHKQLIESLIGSDYATVEEGRLQLTESGFLLADGIAAQLLSPLHRRATL